MPSKTVDITPDKSLIQKLGLTGYRTEQALAELIDNSIDARIEGKIVDIIVKLDWNQKTITASDNGIGMNLNEVEDALTIAKGTKQEEEKLGKFGLGMKSACSTLGKSITIITTKPDLTKEYVVRYDEDEWLSDKSLTWSNFKVEERDKTESWHGTIIVLSKLKVSLSPAQTSHFKNRFSIRYGPFLRNRQIRLKINTLFCEAAEPSLQDGSKKNIRIELSKGNVITGWIGLLKKRSIKGDYGLHLFKNGRLIRVFEKFGISQHPEVAKIIGEITLDHVPVNFHKTGFIEDSEEYKEALFAFKNDSVVKELVRRAATEKIASTAIQSVFNYLSGERISGGTIDTRLSKRQAENLLEEIEPFQYKADNVSIEIELSDEVDSLYELRKSGSTLTAFINRNNEVFKVMKNPIFLIGLISIEAKLAAQNPDKYKEFLYNRNFLWSKFVKDWLPKASKQKRDRVPKIEEIPHYSISDDLVDLYNFLNDRFEGGFDFTALSTLLPYLQNAPGKIIYTLYTQPGGGEQLRDLIIYSYNKNFEQNQFVALFDPRIAELETALSISEKRKFIVIREYSEKMTRSWTVPERAWVDLFIEIHKNKIPISTEELSIILENLIDSDLVNINKLRAIAKRHKMDEKFDPYLERL